MNRRAWPVLLCCAALTATYPIPRAASNHVLSGQTPKSDLVFMYATVQNREGAFAIGLDKSYFTLRSQKEPVDIAYFSAERPAASIALLYDSSNSMKQATQAWQRAVRDGMATLLKQSKENEYMLVFFGNEPTVAAEWSRDTARIIDALNRTAIVKQKGYTALYDTCQMAAEQLSRRATEKRVIIIITDGEDNASRIEYSKLKEILKKSDVLVYSVARGNVIDSLAAYAHGVLSEFSKISGGETQVAIRPSEVTAAFEDIASRLQHQYRIGFRPKTLDDKWHPIELSVTLPPRGNTAKSVRLSVHTRQGYYATAPH
jgi:Ca-activated chloride channel homolog